MTGNLYLDLLISFAGVGVLVAVSWTLGGWRSAPVDAASAAERLAFDEPDFKPGEWLLSVDGRAAAALSEDGKEAALVFRVGDGLATRRFRRGAVPIERSGAALVAALKEPSKWRLRLIAPDEASAARWAGGLGGEAYI
jgi:hypothetical protein